MSQTIPTTAVPMPILRKLRLVRQRKLWVHIASALVAALAVLLAAMGAAMLIDWLATLYDSRWRVVLTTAALSAAAFTIVGWLFYVQQRLLGINRIANDVDTQIPQLEQRWTTVTRLGSDAANPDIVHPAMLRRVAKEAVRWEPNVEPEQIVSLSTLLRSLIGLTAISAILGLAVVLNTHRAIVLMERFWRPTSAISATELVNIPGNLVVGRGEALTLVASVQGTPAERATLLLRTPDDNAKQIDLIAQGKDTIEFSHRLQSVEEPFAYRFRAGDGQSEWYSVNVAERPEIEKLKLIVTPPAYTHRAAASFDTLPSRLSALQNSQLELAIRPKIAVESVEIRFAGGKVERLTSSADGWYQWTTKLVDSIALAPLLTESHGLTNRRAPKCDISVYPDQPPMVKILSPDDQTAVRPDDMLEIAFSASDDTGIGSAELLVYNDAAGNDAAPIATTPIPLGEQQGARSIQQKVELNLKDLMVKHGGELSYEIRVREDRGTPSPGAAQPKSTTASNGQTNSAAGGATSPSPAPAQLATNGKGQPATSNLAEENQQLAEAPPSVNEKGQAANGASPSNENPTNRPDDSQLVAKTSSANGNPTPAEAANGNTTKSTTTVSGAPSDKTSSTATPTRIAANGEPPARDAASERQNVSAERPTADKNPAEPTKDPSGTKPNEQFSVASSPSNPAVSDKSENKSPQNTPTANSTANNATANSKPENGKSQGSASPQTPANNAAPTKATANNQSKSEPNSSGSNSPPSNSVAGSMPEKNATEKKPTKSPETPAGEPPARDATSGRQMVSKQQPANGEKLAEAMPNSSPSSPSDNSAEKMAGDKTSQPSASPANNPKKQSNGSATQANSKQSPANSQSAKNQAELSSPSDPSPGDSMPKRSLDVDAQASSSNRMRLKIDEFAGSFSGQQRAKVEMAIAPELEALDKALAKGQQSAQGVLDELKKNSQWRETHDLEVSNAERSTVDAQGVIDKLQARSKDTPYAFIGLQVSDIGLAHVGPARSDFWKALQSDGNDRPASVRDGWQHLGRARELVAELRGQFERSRREFQLAESVERAKKMYRVYIENAQALLPIQDEDPDRYNRKLAELKVDDEYLKRLQKVLEMRRDLEVELARILSDDPRLLRRFMDALRHRSENLREELARLTAGQNDLNREVRAWSMVEEADRPRIAQLLMQRQVQDASKLAKGAGELQSRYQAWLPLDRESKDTDLAAATKTIQEAANAARELDTAAQRYVAAAQQPAAEATTTPEGTTAPAPTVTAKSVVPADELLTDGQRLYEQLAKLQVALRQLSSRAEEPATASFAANRLLETERLVADTSAWVRQMRAHKAGNYTGAAEVDQYRLAMKTDALAGKLGSVGQMLAGQLNRTDGTLPEPIAQKAREFIATLDKEVSPNQLGAVYALHSNQLPRAVERQKVAGESLSKAEKLYDELMKLAIEELDKLPVQDPIADLLDDPTLDELLAQLEQEIPLAELLGIPNRPSNLQIIGDWLRPGKGGGGGGGGRPQMAMNQVKQDQQRMQQQLNRAYQRAIARALKEATPKHKVEIPKPGKLSDWNRLVSHLGDDLSQGRDKAPPEQYRRAIEQYFAEISRIESESKKKSP